MTNQQKKKLDNTNNFKSERISTLLNRKKKLVKCVFTIEVYEQEKEDRKRSSRLDLV